MEQAKQLNTRLHIRVSKDGANTYYELMNGQMKLEDVSRDDTVEMIMQLASSLRRVSKDGVDVDYELMNGQIKLKNLSKHDIVEMIMQFGSSLRY